MINDNACYTVHIKSKPDRKPNFHHQEWEGCECKIVHLQENERGWLVYKVPMNRIFLGEDYYGLMHLSTIQHITDNNDNIIIETKNSFYTLTKI